MGRLKTPTEGGSGGKRGHSNMEHWVYSHEIKEATRRGRRLDAEREIREQQRDVESEIDENDDR
mgnify:CR=1 FL=1